MRAKMAEAGWRKVPVFQIFVHEPVLFSLVAKLEFTNSRFTPRTRTTHAHAYAHCTAHLPFTPGAPSQLVQRAQFDRDQKGANIDPAAALQ